MSDDRDTGRNPEDTVNPDHVAGIIERDARIAELEAERDEWKENCDALMRDYKREYARAEACKALRERVEALAIEVEIAEGKNGLVRRLRWYLRGEGAEDED